MCATFQEKGPGIRRSNFKHTHAGASITLYQSMGGFLRCREAASLRFGEWPIMVAIAKRSEGGVGDFLCRKMTSELRRMEAACRCSMQPASFCIDDAKLSALSPRVLVAAAAELLCCCLPRDVSFDEKPSLMLIK